MHTCMAHNVRALPTIFWLQHDMGKTGRDGHLDEPKLGAKGTKPATCSFEKGGLEPDLEVKSHLLSTRRASHPNPYHQSKPPIKELTSRSTQPMQMVWHEKHAQAPVMQLSSQEMCSLAVEKTLKPSRPTPAQHCEGLPLAPCKTCARNGFACVCVCNFVCVLVYVCVCLCICVLVYLCTCVCVFECLCV